MAATTPSTESAGVTAVSSPSARRVYYELETHGEASVSDLSEVLGYDEDRVGSLLAVLESHDLVDASEDGVRAE